MRQEVTGHLAGTSTQLPTSFASPACIIVLMIYLLYYSHLAFKVLTPPFSLQSACANLYVITQSFLHQFLVRSFAFSRIRALLAIPAHAHSGDPPSRCHLINRITVLCLEIAVPPPLFHPLGAAVSSLIVTAIVPLQPHRTGGPGVTVHPDIVTHVPWRCCPY